MKLTTGGRRGLIELGRAARKLPQDHRMLEFRAMGMVDAADEVLVVVVTQHGALVRRSKIRGRAIDARELDLQLAGAEAAIDEVARTRPGAASAQLSSAEAALLDEAGFGDGPANLPDQLDRSRIELAILIRRSFTIAEAAKALRVSSSRLRQRLSSKRPTLYGVKHGRGWRIPRFQFESRGTLVRGIEQVVPRVRRDAHPVAVRDWFTTPHPDLVVGADDEQVTPRAWLSSGMPIDVVAALATEI